MWNIRHKGVTKWLKSTIHILLGNQYTREYVVNTFIEATATQKDKVIKSFSIKLWVRRIKNDSFLPLIYLFILQHRFSRLIIKAKRCVSLTPWPGNWDTEKKLIKQLETADSQSQLYLFKINAVSVLGTVFSILINIASNPRWLTD